MYWKITVAVTNSRSGERRYCLIYHRLSCFFPQDVDVRDKLYGIHEMSQKDAQALTNGQIQFWFKILLQNCSWQWRVCHTEYRYAPHNDVSVNDGPHIRRWLLYIILCSIILYYIILYYIILYYIILYYIILYYIILYYIILYHIM